MVSHRAEEANKCLVGKIKNNDFSYIKSQFVFKIHINLHLCPANLFNMISPTMDARVPLSFQYEFSIDVDRAWSGTRSGEFRTRDPLDQHKVLFPPG